MGFWVEKKELMRGGIKDLAIPIQHEH